MEQALTRLAENQGLSCSELMRRTLRELSQHKGSKEYRTAN